MLHDRGFESPFLLRKNKKRSLRCRCCLSDRFIWTAACRAQLDARYRHGRGAAEVDRSADPSSFGHRGKHRHHLDTPPPPFFFFGQSPSHDSLPGGKESGRGKRGHTRIYCTRCAGCCRQHEVNRLLETGNSSFFFLPPSSWSLACRSWFLHLHDPEGASPDKMNMSAGMSENTD